MVIPNRVRSLLGEQRVRRGISSIVGAATDLDDCASGAILMVFAVPLFGVASSAFTLPQYRGV